MHYLDHLRCFNSLVGEVRWKMLCECWLLCGGDMLTGSSRGKAGSTYKNEAA